MEIDTASLFVHRDTDSFITRMTYDSSKLSIIFGFDTQLFISKVYERAFRSSMKKSLRVRNVDHTAMKISRPFRAHGTEHPRVQVDDEAAKNSQEIDLRLQRDMRRLIRECKVLALGTAKSGKGEIIRNMKILESGESDKDLLMFRREIRQNLFDAVQSIISAMEQFGIEPETEENRQFCMALKECPADRFPHDILGTPTGEAIGSFWTDPSILRVLARSSGFSLPENGE